VPESEAAWRDDDGELDFAQLAAVPPVAERVLVRPTTARETLLAAYVGPLLGGGSAVVVVGDDADAIARIATQERIG
jgi:hypothetical protein